MRRAAARRPSGRGDSAVVVAAGLVVTAHRACCLSHHVALPPLSCIPRACPSCPMLRDSGLCSRRRWRRTPEPRRPVPPNLVGKCFNCLSESHVKADYTGPARCFNCLDGGHQARDYPLPARPAPDEGKRGRSPARPACRAGRARRRRSSPRRVSLADTASARTASAGRSPSVPPVCGPPSPETAAAHPL